MVHTTYIWRWDVCHCGPKLHVNIMHQTVYKITLSKYLSYWVLEGCIQYDKNKVWVIKVYGDHFLNYKLWLIKGRDGLQPYLMFVSVPIMIQLISISSRQLKKKRKKNVKRKVTSWLEKKPKRNNQKIKNQQKNPGHLEIHVKSR